MTSTAHRTADRPTQGAARSATKPAEPPAEKTSAETAPAQAADTVGQIERLARRIRLRAVRMIAPHGFGYLGQALSAAETIATLHTGFFRPGTDRFVCSPGHYIITAYAAAAEAGVLADTELARYGQDGSEIEAIGTERSPGTDLTCGSLAQGLSGGAGFALADRLRGAEGTRRTFVLVSDGEVEEGQTWEAALYAAHHRLGDLVVLLDANDSQVDGPVSSLTTVEPLAEKWRSFGWYAEDVDGHDPVQLLHALEKAVADPRPGVVIARTSTTHGLSCLPPEADGHFIKMPAGLAELALGELADDHA
ncbi:transketolase [Streptomyces sp. SID10853]|uniref:1-deoxy-D-xylulose-5-phosphate synthase N-terminal domain-containing protein n=1 Tax=Streptomyces sp. SID10853 TaxID=2706028 RepID=UPI0013C0CF96|nr:1-deoxy-D-xylulose-5-phosphate synthase N-terminal domain-containing protein [Streptomyces sp. SID10853]NDZ78634.1 transketolase [Streptomyces sp. SID10853]